MSTPYMPCDEKSMAKMAASIYASQAATVHATAERIRQLKAAGKLPKGPVTKAMLGRIGGAK